MPLLVTFMNEPIKPIETAGIAPTSEQVPCLTFITSARIYTIYFIAVGNLLISSSSRFISQYY